MGLFSKFIAKIKGTNDFSPADWAELEQELLSSDVGPRLTQEFLEAAKKVKSENAEEALIEIMTQNLSDKSHEPITVQGTTTIMVVGVNGTGKTTSVAKLASHYKRSGKSVVLAAGDTFRAAATEQLTIWSERVGVPIVKQTMGADPSAVAFDTVTSAVSKNADVVIIDTAGRLHNKLHLMDELGKIKRVIQKQLPEAPHEVLLVLDGSTGQNALEQAKQFMAVTNVNALAITKLDGTAKGGVVLAIAHQCKIPVKYIGVGEQINDLLLFDKTEFVDSLFSLNK